MPSLVSHQLSIIKYVVLKKIFFFLCFDHLIWTWTWTWTRTSLDSDLTRTRTSLDLDLTRTRTSLDLDLSWTRQRWTWLQPYIRYRETYKMCSAGSTSWRGLRTTVLRHRCENPFSEVFFFFFLWFSSVFEDEHIWLASTKWRKKMHQNMLTKLDFECFCCTCIDAFQNFKAEDYKSCYLWPFRNLHV